MNYVYIGSIVNTHGIKGELRILSDFDKKELVFKPEIALYIGNEKRKEKIKTYRKHKNFDMVTLEGYENINEVLKYLKKKVYVLREDLHLKKQDYLLEDLLNCEIIENEERIGKVVDIVYNKANVLLKVECKNKKCFYIPKNDAYIVSVDIEKKQIKTQDIQGLII